MNNDNEVYTMNYEPITIFNITPMMSVQWDDYKYDVGQLVWCGTVDMFSWQSLLVTVPHGCV